MRLLGLNKLWMYIAGNETADKRLWCIESLGIILRAWNLNDYYLTCPCLVINWNLLILFSQVLIKLVKLFLICDQNKIHTQNQNKCCRM